MNTVWVVKGQTESGDDYIVFWDKEPSQQQIEEYFWEHYHEDWMAETLNLHPKASEYPVQETW